MRYGFLTVLLLLCGLRLAAQSGLYDQLDAFYARHVAEGRVDYAGATEDMALDELLRQLGDVGLAGLRGDALKALRLNAYNLFVIKGVVDAYPLASVQDLPGFFTKKSYILAGARVSLDELERALFSEFGDARMHFALICGAVSCPAFPPAAFRLEALEAQLDAQARRAVNDPVVLRRLGADTVWLMSRLFDWYAEDFSREKGSVRSYLEAYLEPAVRGMPKLRYQAYDWSLNDRVERAMGEGNNRFRYVVSAALPRGSNETKWFNNLYVQSVRGGEEKAGYFTSILSSLFGVTERLSVGLEMRYRMVQLGGRDMAALEIFTGGAGPSLRRGLATVGPKLRYAPVAAWPNFSVQSALWIPLRSDWEGAAGRPYLDWNGPSWWTQVFNDFSIGRQFAVFAEAGIFWEDIVLNDTGYNRLSTPVTVIGSYFPHRRVNLYLLGNVSPYLNTDESWFVQGGAGAKYQFSSKFELEMLLSLFTNDYLLDNDGRASTFNLGFRVNP